MKRSAAAAGIVHSGRISGEAGNRRRPDFVNIAGVWSVEVVVGTARIGHLNGDRALRTVVVVNASRMGGSTGSGEGGDESTGDVEPSVRHWIGAEQGLTAGVGHLKVIVAVRQPCGRG